MPQRAFFLIAAIVLASMPVQAQTITTVAGNGTAGFCGDGGLATSACLNGPSGVAVGADGTLFIADHYNSRLADVEQAGLRVARVTDGDRAEDGDNGIGHGADKAGDGCHQAAIKAAAGGVTKSKTLVINP